jgi:RNA polymerase sigma factor (TIGR02999 family)
VSNSAEITALINAWKAGDETAFDRVGPVVYEELRRLARQHMRGEQAGHTLQPTALVNEALLRIADVDLDYEDRTHFLAMASHVMRRVLVDHARARRSQKRGGGERPVTFDEARMAGQLAEPDILDLDRALVKLGSEDPRLVQTLELVYFGGLTATEAAKALRTSRTRVFEDLRLAKAWLNVELGLAGG